MIIVSEPSAEAAQRVRTSRSSPARSRSSAARNDTPRRANARPINVHTEELNRSKINNLVPPAGLRSRMVPGRVRIVVGHQGAGIPSRRHRRRSRPGSVGGVVHRMRCSTWPTDPGPLRDKLADATGYPLPTPVLRQANTPRVPLTSVNHGQQRGTVTRLDHRSRPLTAQWSQPSKLGLTRDHRQ